MASLMYNQPPGRMDSSPSTDSLDILDSPSGTLSPPSTPRRGTLRQPTLLDSPSARTVSPTFDDPSANFAPFRREDDREQLTRIFQTILDLIRDRISSSEAEAAVNNLQGHLDIKAMFPDNSDMIERLRSLVDMLHLIRNKLDALDALLELEIADTDTSIPPRLVRQSNRLAEFSESEEVSTDTDSSTSEESSSDSDSESDDLDSLGSLFSESPPSTPTALTSSASLRF